MITRSRSRIGLLITLALAIGSLSACMYYAGDENGLVPVPGAATVKSPPEILSCSATFSQTSRQPYYTTECGWVWIAVPCDDGVLAMHDDCGWWDWECWSVWHYTEVCGDIVLRVEVYDPSDDLNAAKTPSLVIHPGEPLPGVACRLSIPEKEIPIRPQDIMPGAGQPGTKVVSVRYGNVCGRITPTCNELGAIMPLSIAFQDCGGVMYSRNTCSAEVRVK